MSGAMRYPPEWSSLASPQWRQFLIDALHDLTSTSVAEVEGHRGPGEIGDFIEEAYSLFFDTFDLHRQSAAALVDHELFDEAEVRVIDEVARALEYVSRTWGHSPTAAQAFGHPQWQTASEAAAAALASLRNRGEAHWVTNEHRLPTLQTEERLKRTDPRSSATGWPWRLRDKS